MLNKTRTAAASAVLAAGCALGASGALAQDLPDTMTWSSYDVGSAGYAEASAIADAFGNATPFDARSAATLAAIIASTSALKGSESPVATSAAGAAAMAGGRAGAGGGGGGGRS